MQTITFSELPPGTALRTGQVQISQDIARDARIPVHLYRDTFVQSLIMAPVGIEHPIAALGAYWSAAYQPSDYEIETVETLARATATALENARLVSALSRALAQAELARDELRHRVKNAYLAAQSLAMLSLPPDYSRVFAARIAALLAGEVDLITKLPPDHADRVAKHPNTKVEGALYSGLYVLMANSKRPPLDNPKVKQALSLGIDRESIVKDLFRGQGIVPSQPIAKGDNHFDESLPPLKYDPSLAKQRLKEAGYKGEEIVIESGQGLIVYDKEMGEAVVSMWRDIGVNAKLELLETTVRAQKLREKTFKGFFWADPTSILRDPDGMMWRILGPGGIYDYWRHPRFDELGDGARFSVDEKFRGQAYKEMTKIFQEQVPWIEVIQPIELYGLQKYMDWKAHPIQQIELRGFNFKFRRP